MSVESWLNEMDNRTRYIEKECGARRVNPEVMKIMIDRCIEPYGLWRENNSQRSIAPVNPEETRNALEAAKRKYKLKEAGADLKIDGHLEKDKFSECAAFLKGFGYSYDKEIKGFKKGVQ